MKCTIQFFLVYSWSCAAIITIDFIFFIFLFFILFFFLKILFIYSWETQRESGRDTGRERSRLHAGRDSIPRLQDRALGQRQALNRCTTQESPFFLNFIYLFMRDTQTERGKDTGRGRSRLQAGNPMWDLIPGLQDHTLG